MKSLGGGHGPSRRRVARRRTSRHSSRGLCCFRGGSEVYAAEAARPSLGSAGNCGAATQCSGTRCRSGFGQTARTSMSHLVPVSLSPFARSLIMRIGWWLARNGGRHVGLHWIARSMWRGIGARLPRPRTSQTPFGVGMCWLSGHCSRKVRDLRRRCPAADPSRRWRHRMGGSALWLCCASWELRDSIPTRNRVWRFRASAYFPAALRFTSSTPATSSAAHAVPPPPPPPPPASRTHPSNTARSPNPAPTSCAT